MIKDEICQNCEEIDESTPGIIDTWFDYNPETGEVFWKRWISPQWYKYKWRHDKFLKERAGKLVKFYTINGYKNIKVGKGYTIYEHQIVWVKHHGAMPTHFIDHIDGNKLNNKIENLRDVPQTINMRNAQMRVDNTSGAVGVYRNGRHGSWYTRVVVGGDCKHIGIFDTVEEAAAARDEFLKCNPQFGFTERHGKCEE